MVWNGDSTQIPWTAYTPTWAASTTNPTIGNGTIGGAYQMLANKVVLARIEIQVGSTTNVGVGNYTVSLPPGLTPHADIATWDAIGTCTIFDATGGATGHWGVVAGYVATGLVTGLGYATRLTNASPVALAVGDRITFMLQYEIA